jgi:hypothetical protein
MNEQLVKVQLMSSTLAYNLDFFPMVIRVITVFFILVYYKKHFKNSSPNNFYSLAIKENDHLTEFHLTFLLDQIFRSNA